jgi:hypothetical protein
MDMNPVEGLGASRKPMPLTPQKSGRPTAPQAPAGATSDRVEFSADARKLAAGATDAGASREELIAAARQKLLSGQLSDPAVAARAAEKLLRSGDLGNGSAVAPLSVKEDADGTHGA